MRLNIELIDPLSPVALQTWLPADVIERWRASGPGWQTRMAERLARGPIPRARD